MKPVPTRDVKSKSPMKYNIDLEFLKKNIMSPNLCFEFYNVCSLFFLLLSKFIKKAKLLLPNL